MEPQGLKKVLNVGYRAALTGASLRTIGNTKGIAKKTKALLRAVLSIDRVLAMIAPEAWSLKNWGETAAIRSEPNRRNWIAQYRLGIKVLVLILPYTSKSSV
jgi:hypothetical protein